MIEGTSFRTAVLLSAVSHLFLIWGGSRLSPFQQIRPADRIAQELKVFYSSGDFEALQQRKGTGFEKEISTPKEVNATATEVITSPRGEEAPFSVKEEGKEALHRTVLSEKESLSPLMKSEPVTLPQGEETSFEEGVVPGLHLSGEEKPLYFAYYQNIRERIRQSVRAHYPEGTLEGRVLLTFVLFANGQLKEVATSEKKPFQDRRLKEVALRSVVEAAPFPPFPEGLRRPFVPFRVSITFVSERKSFIGE